MRVVSLGSGSSGNALLVEAGPNGRTKLLVDAGFSERILRERLRSAGVALSQIQGVLITHEHADHIYRIVTDVKSSTGIDYRGSAVPLAPAVFVTPLAMPAPRSTSTWDIV